MSAAFLHGLGAGDSAIPAPVQIPDSLDASVVSIAVISPDAERRNAAISALVTCRNSRIREFISYPPGIEDVARMLRQDFDIVIVDLDSDPEHALDLVESVSAHGLANIIVYSDTADPDLMLRCMHAGAREFLTLPLTQSAMAEALVRASARTPEPQIRNEANGKLLVFLGAKGGSGVTTLACYFAVSLAEASQRPTLLIDLNLPLGDAAINLGIKAQYSTLFAFENSSHLDPHFLSTLLARHSSGLSVLAAPSELAPMDVSSEAIDRLLEVARREFEYVVVDAGSRLDLRRTTLFDESATLYLVTQVGIPELRNSNRLIMQLSRTGGPKLEIVVNRYDPRSMAIDEAHVTKALTKPAEWKIPNNYAAVRRMQDTGSPLTHDNSQIARAIREMTRSVCGSSALPEKKRGLGFF
jgi:pilus assembly protein CpaE